VAPLHLSSSARARDRQRREGGRRLLDFLSILRAGRAVDSDGGEKGGKKEKGRTSPQPSTGCGRGHFYFPLSSDGC